MIRTCKNIKARRYFSLFLAFIMVLGVIMMPAFELKANAQGNEDNLEMLPMAADPPINWEDPEPTDPNYWPREPGTVVKETLITYMGLRYAGKTNNTFKLEMVTTLTISEANFEYIEFRIDPELAQYVQGVKARGQGALWLWRDAQDMGDGVYRFPFYYIKNGLIPALNAGVFSTFEVPIEIRLKDGNTTDSIPQKEYTVQTRVLGNRRGVNFVARESVGVNTVIFENPPTVDTGNWLQISPAYVIAEFDNDTNILRYTWRGNPTVPYSLAIPARKPYVLNVVVDPAIVEASESVHIYTKSIVASDPKFELNKDIFKSEPNPGFLTAKITEDNGSVPKTSTYIRKWEGAPNIPVYTVMEFKINPEQVLQGANHHSAPIKMFFTTKLGTNERLIKNSSGENFFTLSKTFFNAEVNDMYTEDAYVTGFTKEPEMFVKVTFPNGEVAEGYSSDTPNAEGKYEFSIAVPDSVDLKKGDEIEVQNAEIGKTLSDPVVETVNARITFNYNYDGAPEILVVEANDDKNINNLGELMPEDPARDGFIFMGWFDNPEGNGEEFTKDSTIVKSKPVYAKWDTALAYKVVYIVDKEEDSSLEENGFVPSSEPVVNLADIMKDIPGKNFLYVKPEADSLGQITVPADGVIKMYYAGDIIDVTDPDDPTPPGYSRIIFDAGDHGKFDDGVVYIFDVKNGVEFPADKAPEVLVNDGFEFVKWNPTPPFVVSEAMTILAEYKATVFDPDKVVGMKITTPPDKVVYTEGETFDPKGMVVTLTDSNGLTKEVPYEEFANNYLTVPTEVLSLGDTKVTVTYEKDTKILRDDQPITVNEMLPSAKPVDLKQVFEDEEQKIVGKFENGYKPDPATSEVILVDKDGKPFEDAEGNPIKGVIKDEGTFEFPIDDLNDNDEVFVQLTEKGKKPTVSEESVIVDKLGPNVEVVDSAASEDFINIKAKVNEPDAEVIIKVGDKEIPVTPDEEGNFEVTFPSDYEGDIVIVAKDELGNVTEKEVNREEFEQVDVKVRGKKPYAGNFTFTAYGADGVTAKIQHLRDNEVLETQEKVIVNGRTNFVLKQPLEVNDILTLQGISGSYSSEPISYLIEK